MKLETKYDLYDRVVIVEINMPGVITEIKFDTRLLYVVEYWWEGGIRVVNLFEKDLCYPK